MKPIEIYDGHGDIWYDVLQHSLKGERDVFCKYQLPKFKKGHVKGGSFAVWIDPPYDEDPVARMAQFVKAMKLEMEDAADILNIVKSRDDFEKGERAGKINAVVALEGLSYIGEDIDLINYYYDEIHARTMMLTWNEENALASGWPGDPDRGLTQKGREAVRRMNELGILVDVSHLNDKGTWDILSMSDGHPVIASHSDCRALCNQGRNVTDDMIREIAKTGGLIGMNRLNGFISDDRAKQNVDGLVDHVIHIADLVGIDYVGCGFDFEDFVVPDALQKNGFTEHDPYATKGLGDASNCQNFVDAMRRRGLTEEEIEKVAYKNFYRVYKSVLK